MQRLGITRTQFDALPEEEQYDWLALEYMREQHLAELVRAVSRAIDDKKPIDGGAYMSLLLEEIG
jgi:hypothetical protein